MITNFVFGFSVGIIVGVIITLLALYILINKLAPKDE